MSFRGGFALCSVSSRMTKHAACGRREAGDRYASKEQKLSRETSPMKVGAAGGSGASPTFDAYRNQTPGANPGGGSKQSATLGSDPGSAYASERRGNRRDSPERRALTQKGISSSEAAGSSVGASGSSGVSGVGSSASVDSGASSGSSGRLRLAICSTFAALGMKSGVVIVIFLGYGRRGSRESSLLLREHGLEKLHISRVRERTRTGIEALLRLLDSQTEIGSSNTENS